MIVNRTSLMQLAAEKDGPCLNWQKDGFGLLLLVSRNTGTAQPGPQIFSALMLLCMEENSPLKIMWSLNI